MVRIYQNLLFEGVSRLKAHNIEDGIFNARELLGKALSVDCRSNKFDILLEKEISADIEKSFFDILERRIQGEPLQYLIGEWEFYGLPFKVGRGVLIPRQDTETIVDTVLKKMKGKKDIIFADLCSGSGCIALAVEKHLSCREIYCVEKSAEAAGYLRENISLNNSHAKAVEGDILDSKIVESIPECDLITANPPYLTQNDMNSLQKEVRFEPETALFGGSDGLDFYRNIIRLWKSRLKENGMIAFEIGMGQEDEVMKMLVQHGFVNVRCTADLCGVNRCVFGFKPKAVQEIGQKIDFDKLSRQTDS